MIQYKNNSLLNLIMDYQNGKIYKIISNETTKYYIGSTTINLEKRLSGHKNSYKRFLNGYTYDNFSSFELLKLGDVKIELIENYPCRSKKELEMREAELQYQFQSNIVNYRVAVRNKEKHNEKRMLAAREYRKLNKEKDNLYQKQRYAAKKEKLSINI